MEKPTCRRCRYGEWNNEESEFPGMYHCLLADDWLEEEDGDNEELPCEGFEPDDN